jgi:hypothetical protein
VIDGVMFAGAGSCVAVGDGKSEADGEDALLAGFASSTGWEQRGSDCLETEAQRLKRRDSRLREPALAAAPTGMNYSSRGYGSTGSEQQ